MKIPTNIPQGYKSSPLGIIPKDWEVKRLEEVCVNAGEYGLNAPAVDYNPALPTYLRITDIDVDGTFIKSDKKSVMADNALDYYLSDGDIVFARTGATVGKSYLYNPKDGRLVFAGFLIRFSPDKNKIVPYYIKCLTETIGYHNWVSTISTRSGQPGINAQEYASFQFPLPPLAEQERIAELLGTWDRAIEMQKQLIDKLELRKKGLMQQLLPAKGHKVPNLRFPEFVNTIKWTEKRVSDIFQITRGLVLATTSTKNKQDTKYKYPVYSSQTKDGGLMGYYDNFLYEDAITWTTDGANAGTVFFRSGKFYCTNVCGVLINKEGYANQCLAEIIGKQSKKYVSYVGNPKLMNNVMAEIPICVPSLQELRKIAYFLSSIDEQIATEKNKLALFQAQKKGLMQVLLTGKKRI